MGIKLETSEAKSKQAKKETEAKPGEIIGPSPVLCITISPGEHCVSNRDLFKVYLIGAALGGSLTFLIYSMIKLIMHVL